MKPESQDAMPKDPAMQGATKMDVDEEKESDSDSSSMSDDDDEEEIDETIAILELRLKTCGGRDYEAHAELMRILREKNMMKKLEKAREAFSREFPLTDGEMAHCRNGPIQTCQDVQDGDRHEHTQMSKLVFRLTCRVWFLRMTRTRRCLRRALAGVDRR